jgi:hypothetical protein
VVRRAILAMGELLTMENYFASGSVTGFDAVTRLACQASSKELIEKQKQYDKYDILT